MTLSFSYARLKTIKRALEHVVSDSSKINKNRVPSVLELSSRSRRVKEIKMDRCLRESVLKTRTGG